MSEGQRFRFGVLADIHAAPPTAEPYVWQNLVDLPHSLELLDAGLSWLAGQQLDALVLLGDLTERADWDSFQQVRERATALGIAVAAAPGNCDVDPVDRSLTAFDSLRQGTMITSPDLVEIGPGRIMELIHLAEVPDGRQLTGLRSPHDAFMPHSSRIVLTHYPVLDLETELAVAGFRHSGNLTNRAEIEAELRALQLPVIVLHGHLHIHHAHISGSMLHLANGALIEPPHLVSVVELTFDRERIAVTREAHSVREDAVERVPVFTPLQQQWNWSPDLGWADASRPIRTAW